ncbi:DNA damage-binding protein 1a [Rhizopus stolonifer]|uniref:DNA damage-binding protein 1 n=1 Tax=Rhizopus stolonifer TaxID=4846 RepID=A0A367K1F3_RHIST|nr:DNA damage-binding protein 1a [Rhizopus stolonifer]
MLVIDPSCSYFATSLYESTVTIVIPDASHQQNTAPIRKMTTRAKEGKRRQTQDYVVQHPSDYINLSLSDKQIVSLAFLQDKATEPTLLILYDDPLGRRYLQQFTVDIKDRQLLPGDILMDHFEPDANLLISMPATVGGVVLIAGKFIRYLKPNQPPIAIGIRSCTINSYTVMNQEGSRILLGDAGGALYLLNMTIFSNRVDALSFLRLGMISVPSCLSYLGNDVVFVGSTVADSQIIHIRHTDGEVLDVIDEFPNLGPITDFCVADLDKQGQTQLITCSGVGKDSSLRIIRNGVGLNELAAIKINGVKGVWALRPSFDEIYDDMLVLSFVNQTCLLALRGNGMTRLASHSAIDTQARTLVASNVMDDLLVQVTDKSIRLMESKPDGVLLDEWVPKDHAQITVASINPTQCVVSTGYGTLYAFQIKHRTLELIATTQLENEIACIDISPIDASHPHESSVVAVGTWSHVGVCILSLPSLQFITQEKLAGTVMPRSLLMATFENICYLLVALGDGQFYNFKLDVRQGKLSDKKRSFLGKLPIHLARFTSNGTTHVFAASDKPSVIHNTPRRITYQETSKTFGLITERITSEPYKPTTTTGGFEILEDQSFAVLDRVYFQQFERPLSATSITFENDHHEYYILATGKETDEYENSSIGRICVFQVTPERKLKLVNQIKTDGMVDSVRSFNGRLIASIRGMLHVFKWEYAYGKGTLILSCSKRLPSITESITTYNDLIMTGDMAYSVVVLSYDPKTETLTEVAAHEKLKEIVAIEASDENLYVAAEREGHLFVVERCQDESDEPILETVSVWHLGDSVKRFRFGSLGMNASDPDRNPEASTLIFATTNGSIGLIADLSAERFKLLDQMQYNMSRIVKSIGDLSHIDWRSVSIMDRKDDAVNFIDGDLIESFLDLTPQQMQGVVDGVAGGRKLDKSVEDLCKVVEELMSTHP